MASIMLSLVDCCRSFFYLRRVWYRTIHMSIRTAIHPIRYFTLLDIRNVPFRQSMTTTVIPKQQNSTFELVRYPIGDIFKELRYPS